MFAFDDSSTAGDRTRVAFRKLLSRWALPQYCIFCGCADTQSALCAGCRDDLPSHDAPRCPVCADLAPQAQTCGQCLAHPPRFSHVVCAVSYRFPVDGAIQRLKYGAQLALVDPLADLLARRVAGEPRPDLVVPMPLGALRLRERGFNQALEIARALSKRLNLSLAPHACRRVRDTAPQAGLPFDQRRKNVRGVFACDENLDGAHVAVVDDVITTGETLNEAARTLLRAGASKVVGWAVARTPRG